ncbi:MULTISPECIES: YggT family protein [Oceanospirillaceae]|jgi:YggT family protein|uniref:YggT family protein n=1 Tax=Oceanobacter antarcticus TaxID=3133425 RepID=A0ABW8NHT1_9GAMM
MSPLSQVGMLLVNTIGSMVLLVFLLRFLLQLVRADFYNPISQFILRFSNPLLIPLRRVIPGFGGLDIASLVLAYLAQLLLMIAILLVAGQFSLPWGYLLVWAVIGLMSLWLNIYFWGLVIIVIASWIAPNSYNPALILINQIIEPAIRPIRNAMPNLGGLDLSPIIAFLLIQVLQIMVIGQLAALTGMPHGLAMGM